MKVAVVVAAMLSVVAVVVSVVLALFGIYSLISGRCSLLGNKARGGRARTAGAVLALQLIAGMAVYAMFFEALGWGSYRRAPLVEPLAQALILAAASVAGYLIAVWVVRHKDHVGLGDATTPGRE
jgi:hypothetical protein